MKSTGEVMGIDSNFGIAFAKSQIATNQLFPTSGNVFISVNDKDKDKIIPIARELIDLEFKLIATKGTGEMLEGSNIKCDLVLKISEGRPNVLDLIKNRGKTKCS
jgi:carbamoyl-phosphate synthase large subunit